MRSLNASDVSFALMSKRELISWICLWPTSDNHNKAMHFLRIHLKNLMPILKQILLFKSLQLCFFRKLMHSFDHCQKILPNIHYHIFDVFINKLIISAFFNKSSFQKRIKIPLRLKNMALMVLSYMILAQGFPRVWKIFCLSHCSLVNRCVLYSSLQFLRGIGYKQKFISVSVFITLVEQFNFSTKGVQ